MVMECSTPFADETGSLPDAHQDRSIHAGMFCTLYFTSKDHCHSPSAKIPIVKKLFAHRNIEYSHCCNSDRNKMKWWKTLCWMTRQTLKSSQSSAQLTAAGD